MRLALVHDYLTNIGGAEKVLQALGETWQEAPIYSLLGNKDDLPAGFLTNPVYESFLKRFPSFFKKRKKWLLPLFMVSPETLDLSDFDVIISSSGAFSKAIVTKPNVLNICYCHSPMRFGWDYTHEYLKEQKLNKVSKFFLRIFLNYLRIWDFTSAERVDYFIANSYATKTKIRKYYRKEARVIYPPVDTKMFRIAKNSTKIKKDVDFPNEYFLIVSRLSPYKKIHIAIEAFNKLGWNLVIIGEGQEKERLKRIAKDNIKILGGKKQTEVVRYFQNCLGYILPNEEDFGISAVEAMASGKPVLALKKGGALETIVEGVTGEFFDVLTPEILAEGVFRLKSRLSKYNPLRIRAYAENFSKERFQKEMKYEVEKLYQNNCLC